jgi:tetratricopeptide (TPR) repeat protein
MQLNGHEPTFRKIKPHSNPYRMMVWVVLIVGFFALIRANVQGNFRPFLPTPTPTRTTNSYAQEAETHFTAGDLNKAIEAYQKATLQEPDNYQLWSNLARIQTYSSELLTTDQQKFDRLNDAVASARQGVKVAPTQSSAHAILAFALDWRSSNKMVPHQEQNDNLFEADQEANNARHLDETNTLALAYYAEILVDEQKWSLAQEYIQQAMTRDPNSMDVRRINAYVYESMGGYRLAIEEYKAATTISPNLTFLYISIGKIYRSLLNYPQALDYFDKAAKTNAQLGIKDPIPYLAIANTYAQDGQPLVAVRNVKKAMSLNPTSPDVYAQLGMIYIKSRNYESALPAFDCAINGCDTVKSCAVRQCDENVDPPVVITGVALTDNTVGYFYSYGSVLAAMHRPTDLYCKQSMVVLTQVKDSYASDSTIMSIVKASEDICAGQ